MTSQSMRNSWNRCHIHVGYDPLSDPCIFTGHFTVQWAKSFRTNITWWLSSPCSGIMHLPLIHILHMHQGRVRSSVWANSSLIDDSSPFFNQSNSSCISMRAYWPASKQSCIKAFRSKLLLNFDHVESLHHWPAKITFKLSPSHHHENEEFYCMWGHIHMMRCRVLSVILLGQSVLNDIFNLIALHSSSCQFIKTWNVGNESIAKLNRHKTAHSMHLQSAVTHPIKMIVFTEDKLS